MNYRPALAAGYRIKRIFVPIAIKSNEAQGDYADILAQCDELVEAAQQMNGANEIARITNSVEDLATRILPNMSGREIDRLKAGLTALKIEQYLCRRRGSIEKMASKTRGHVLHLACDIKEALIRSGNGVHLAN